MEFRLGAADPTPLELANPGGASRLALSCEHGGRAIPACLADRAPTAADMDRHIAWDVGAAAVARGLSARLDAALALQAYSRLVIDCNRPRAAPDLTPSVSDGSAIPFNQSPDAAELDARWQAIHRPFHDGLAALLAARRTPALAAIHSFTPQLRGGAQRPMAIGLLCRINTGFAEALGRALARREPALVIAMNQPYRIEDESDYTIPHHAEAQGLPHVLIEIRNDLIGDAAGAERWSDLLAAALTDAMA